MMNGPRIYNALSPEEREARLRRKQEARRKQIHRGRKTRILAAFAIIFLVFGIQIGAKTAQVHRLNDEVEASRNSLSKVKTKKANLTNQRNALKDPNYVAKLIRSKFYYSKTNEKVYNLPGGKKN